MGVNAMTFNQLSTVLNAIVKQATGKEPIAITDEASFISVAKVGLETGYDPLMQAISQVLTRTIFSNRPYSRKFKGLAADSARYGNHVRKLQLVDREWEDDNRIKLEDGQSIDQYKVKKPIPLQTNFYGENVVSDKITIFRDQLDTAFSSSSEFGSFIAMVMQNMQDRIEQKHEVTARATISNFIAGKSVCDADNVIYLLDAYEDETGITGLTPDIIKQPEYFVPFAKWLMGFLKTKSDLLTERTIKFHKNFTIDGKAYDIARHTPLASQKFYCYSKDLNDIDATVLSSTFHDEYLKIMDHERVNFWQSIDTPQGIYAKPGYNKDDGSVEPDPAQVSLSNVFGIIFDEEAIGYTTINEWSATTPFNADGGYTNMYWHFTDRYWNDFTENAIVLILDHSDRQLTALTVTSEEGSTSGKTAITVDPEKGDGETYAYKLGSAAEVVTYGQDVTSWTAWNGTDEISVDDETVISLVIAKSNRAIGSGSATIVKKNAALKAAKK